MKLSVIIPVFNEEATLEQIFKKVHEVPLPVGVEKEIVLVNDGSTDNSPVILRKYHDLPGIVVVHQENKGKTGAVLSGLAVASGDVFIIQDADLEYDPAHFPILMNPILRGEFHIVYGSRFMGTIKHMAPINRWANNISNVTINALYGVKLTDINTCYKMFTRHAMEGIVIKGKGFDMDCEMTVKMIKKGLRIKELPITYEARSRAAGKKIKWSTAVTMFWQIIKYRFVI